MKINADSINWLLESDNPGVRYLAMRDFSGLTASDPVLETAAVTAHREGPIGMILSKMQPEGFWVREGRGYGPKYKSTVWALILLAQLGAHIRYDARIQTGINYLIDHTLTSYGQFSYNKTPSGTFDCLQGNLCWAVSVLGYEDERMKTVYEWMARTVTGEGIADQKEKGNPIRYYSYKCGPLFACGANNREACAWGAVKIMNAFSILPTASRTPIIRKAILQGVEFLLSVDPVTAVYPTGALNPPNRSWWKLGFPVFYITDILQIAEVLAELGCIKDHRLQNTLEWISSKQDENGRWNLEYDYSGKTWGSYGQKKQPNPWVTMRALRVLKQLNKYEK